MFEIGIGILSDVIFTEAAIRSELKKCGNILNESSILDKFVG